MMQWRIQGGKTKGKGGGGGWYKDEKSVVYYRYDSHIIWPYPMQQVVSMQADLVFESSRSSEGPTPMLRSKLDAMFTQGQLIITINSLGYGCLEQLGC